VSSLARCPSSECSKKVARGAGALEGILAVSLDRVHDEWKGSVDVSVTLSVSVQPLRLIHLLRTELALRGIFCSKPSVNGSDAIPVLRCKRGSVLLLTREGKDIETVSRCLDEGRARASRGT
jgi:hypothetical protein